MAAAVTDRDLKVSEIRRSVLEHPIRSGPFEARRTVSSVKIPADG
jgi:hypothetical protein